MSRRPFLALVLPALLSACAAPQASDGYRSVTARRAGLELRGYPAGVTAMAHSLWPAGERDAWFVAAGANLTDRRDWGEHDDEEGGGSGLGGGWRRYRDEARTGAYWGGRLDIWSLEIDWQEDDGREGTTEVFVAQPIFESGFAWAVGGPWVIEAGLGFGVEINADTDGEDVGEGTILLGTFVVSAGF